MSRRQKRTSATRVVGYGYSVPHGEDCVPDVFDEADMDRLLYKARASGTVTEYDTGRCAIVWFNGAPGAELRRLRDRVRAMFQVEPTPLR